MGDHGHASAKFKRCLDRGHYKMARLLALEVPRIELRDALRLTILAATEEPERYELLALSWLERFIVEREPPILIISLAASLLADVKAGGRRSGEMEEQLLALAGGSLV